ncbi:hypothetical protein FOA52_015004 [Chlamydomonas sp. UWO 241]|nr:hypothetical protein FOA52_015004 [Chlamydomonas sp. UWO 241]
MGDDVAGQLFAEVRGHLQDDAGFEELDSKLEGFVALFLGGSGEVDRKVPPIDELELKKSNAAIQALKAHSELGGVVIGLVQSGLEGLPFGAPLGALLGCVYRRAAKAAINTNAAEALLRHIEVVHRHLHGFAQGGKSNTPDLEQSCKRLLRLIALTASGRGFLKRMLMSNTDEAKFGHLTERVKEEMLTIAFVAVAEWGPRPEDSQLPPLPDAKALRTELAKLAGFSNGEMMSGVLLDKCLADVARDKPGKLRALLHGARLEDRIIDAALGEISEHVSMVQVEVVMIQLNVKEMAITLKQLGDAIKTNQHRPLAGLLPALNVWWSKNVGSLKMSVDAHEFASKLATWMREKGHEQRLQEYEAELASRGFHLIASGSVPRFLDPVLVWLVDADGDGLITKNKLAAVQIRDERFADQGQLSDGTHAPTPSATSAAHKLLEELEKYLQVKAVIQSYQIPMLLEDYVRCTRVWLYEEVTAWFKAARSHIFMLLGGPGMGKTIFSAVMHKRLVADAVKAGQAMVLVKHFFKVGEERAQLLLPVAEKHCNGAELSMEDAFAAFLLGQLKGLDRTSRFLLPTVVILLDALDEEVDGTRDWLPVADLIAHK